MVNVRLFLFLIGLSLIVGLPESGRKARAAVPAACPMYECKTVHAWWSGTIGNIQACFTVGGGEMDNSSTSQLNIFTQSSVEKKPQVANGKMDVWNYDACTPMCGKDANGKWQALQEVGRAGKRGTSVPNVDRTACTSNNGNNGPQVQNPSNANGTNGHIPPGVDDNGDPIGGGGINPPPPPPGGGP